MIAVGERDGRVVLQFPGAVEWVALDPQNAADVGEAMARCAHGIAYGSKPPRSALSANVRKRLIARVQITLRSLQGQSPAYVAATLVDAVLSEVL